MDFPETNSRLLKLLQDAQAPEWQDFYLLYWDVMVRVARKSGLCLDDAEEVAQMSLIKVAGGMPRFKYDRDIGFFRDYLKAVLRNTLRDFFRKRGRQAAHLALFGEEQDEVEKPIADFLAEELKKTMLEKWLQQLRKEIGEKKVAIFVQYFFNRVPAKKIAEEQGIPLGELNKVYNTAWGILRRLQALASDELSGAW